MCFKIEFIASKNSSCKAYLKTAPKLTTYGDVGQCSRQLVYEGMTEKPCSFDTDGILAVYPSTNE